MSTTLPHPRTPDPFDLTPSPVTARTPQRRPGRCSLLLGLAASLALAGCSSSSAGGSGVDGGGDTGTDTSAPEIVSQPASRSVLEGGSATFSVTATGGGTLAYQWYKGAAAITGATAASYTLDPVSASDAGSYLVIVTGTYGTVTSTTVTLTVLAPEEVADTWDLENGSNPMDVAANTTFDYALTLTSGAAGLQSVTSSAAADLVVGATSGGVTSVTLDGAEVVTVTETSDELRIVSDLPDDLHVELILTGSFARTIQVTSNERLRLTLRDADVTAPAGPALYVASAVRAYLTLEGTSTLTDAASYTVDASAKAALHGVGPLLLDGDGALTVTGNKKHAVYSADHVRVAGGTIHLLANAGNAVHTVRAFVMDGGSLEIETADDVGKGIKVDGAEDATAPLGFIVVNAGTLDVSSYDKAMTAAWECLEDGDLACTGADPDPFVTINGGAITIRTFGTPCDTSEPRATCTEDLSPEGIESKSDLTVNGGELAVTTTDDALNAGAGIFITGGRIYAHASANDAIDSNGVMTISGGTIVAEGTVVPEGGLDADSGTGSHRFTVTGGTFIGTGGTNTIPTVASQDVVSTSGGTPGNTLAVRDDTAGSIAFAFQLPSTSSAQALQAMLLSTPAFATGHSYSIYKGATVTCTAFHGLCTGAITTGALGTASSTFTMAAGVNTR